MGLSNKMDDTLSRNPVERAGEETTNTLILVSCVLPYLQGVDDITADDVFLAEVHCYVAYQELPDHKKFRKAVPDIAQDCVIDQGILKKYFPSDSLDETALEGCLKILVPLELCMQLIRQYHDPTLLGHFDSAETYARFKG